MREVRREILERKVPGRCACRKRPPATGRRNTTKSGLFRAALAQSRNEVDLLVTPTRVPLVGPVVDFVRRKFHELVVFYINRSAMNQAKVNHHILAALSILGQADPAGAPALGEATSATQDAPVTLDDIRAGYRLFFGNEPEAADLDYWMNLLATEHVTRERLIESFLDKHPSVNEMERNGITTRGPFAVDCHP